MTLEEEYKALLSDKDGETEYLCSLQDQVEQIKVDTFIYIMLFSVSSNGLPLWCKARFKQG